MPQLYNDDIYVGDFAIETPSGKLNISESGVSVVKIGRASCRERV
jgi:hypothetical protein